MKNWADGLLHKTFFVVTCLAFLLFCAIMSVSATKEPCQNHTPGLAATCTRDQVCITCGEVLQEKTGHTYVKETIPPSCTNPGYDLYTCYVCLSNYQENFVKAAGHSSSGQATCKNAEVCTKCGVELTPKEEHKYKSQVTKRMFVEKKEHTPSTTPLCEGDIVCVECGIVLMPQVTHTAGDWQISLSPTATTPGERYKACIYCHRVMAIESLPPSSEGNIPTDTQDEGVTSPDPWGEDRLPEEEDPDNIVTLPSQQGNIDATGKNPTMGTGCASVMGGAWVWVLMVMLLVVCVKRKKKCTDE